MDAAGAEARIAAGDPLTLSLSGPPLGIEGVTATYTLFLEGGLPSTEVVATLGVGEESTASADDYSGLPGSITIPAGESSESFRVTFEKDSVQEDEESLVLTLTGAHGGVVRSLSTPRTASFGLVFWSAGSSSSQEAR